MKKTFKILLAILACAVLMCPLFAGCANSAADFVSGSYDYEIDSYSFGVYVDGDFLVNFPESGEYAVEYELCLYYKQKLVANKSCKKTATVAGGGEQKVSVYENFDVKWELTGDTSAQSYTTKIRNLVITKEKTYDNSQGYAIGFGVTAAVLTCAITVYFVITKLSEKKGNNTEQ